MSQTAPFVSTDWLAERLGAPGLAIVDGSWFLPTQGRNGHTEYLQGHIPGAAFFDLDTIADTASGLPHMLPSPEAFAQAIGRLGIGDGMQIVVYDALGLFSAPRVRWTLQVMGAEDVCILEGGMPRWRSEGRPVETGPVAPPVRIFTPRFQAARVAGLDAVAAALDSDGVQVVDVRPAARYRGEAPEPRPGLRAGHMPGSLNLPFTELVGADGRLRPAADLAGLFDRHGIDLDRPVIASCGSGVSASILALALEALGRNDARVYDGSWAEWGARADLPVVIGEEPGSVR